MSHSSSAIPGETKPMPSKTQAKLEERILQIADAKHNDVERAKERVVSFAEGLGALGELSDEEVEACIARAHAAAACRLDEIMVLDNRNFFGGAGMALILLSIVTTATILWFSYDFPKFIKVQMVISWTHLLEYLGISASLGHLMIFISFGYKGAVKHAKEHKGAWILAVFMFVLYGMVAFDIADGMNDTGDFQTHPSSL